jgi:hypothetical protein
MYGIYENGKVIAKFTAPLSVKSNQPVFVSDALSLRRFVSQRSAQRWEIETGVEPLSASAQDLMVSLITKGPSETVQVLMPQNYGGKKVKVQNSDLPVNATAPVNSTSVTISGFVGFVPKGTFIRFSNHSKVYMTTTNLTNSGSLGVYPPLRIAVSPSTTVKGSDNVLMDCLYDTDTVRGMQYSDGILMDVGTIRLIEKV